MPVLLHGSLPQIVVRRRPVSRGEGLVRHGRGVARRGEGVVRRDGGRGGEHAGAKVLKVGERHAAAGVAHKQLAHRLAAEPEAAALAGGQPLVTPRQRVALA